jgi:four helix bundle protein
VKKKGGVLKISHFREPEVDTPAFDAAMKLFEITKGFPPEEKYSLADKIRRSSRSVCSTSAESWRKKYKAVFKNKFDSEYEIIISKLNAMDLKSDTCCF